MVRKIGSGLNPYRLQKSNFLSALSREKLVIGMVHLRSLPGSPGAELNPGQILSTALREVEVYTSNGIKTVILENMHDLPYTKGAVDPVAVASMSAIASEINRKFDVFCGIQILAAANREALAVARATGCDFIRVENFAYAHVADEGYLESCAGKLLRYRKQIRAEDICIFSDLRKKHCSHALTSDLKMQDWADTAEFLGSDGLIITGRKTGEPPKTEDFSFSTSLPVLIGSGVDRKNLPQLWEHADGFIVGSDFKQDGLWYNSVSNERVQAFMIVFKELARRI